ncbi:dTDP-glucose 4,6-dehydratase [Pigmentibacter ruber]
MFSMKNVLVTGSAGFIGCNFVRNLLNNNDEIKVISLDKLTYAGNLKNLENLPNIHNHLFIQGDICNQALIEKLIEQYKINCIIHFAAESHVDRSITGPSEFIQTNIFGTFSLLEAARKKWLDEYKWDKNICRFHHISTDEVFGTLNELDPPFSETTAYAPNSPYSASKAGSDHLVRAYFHTYSLPVTTSNCSNNYGPYQHKEKLIPTVIKSCLSNNFIPVYGDGSNIRDWLYVLDHCLAIEQIIKNGKIGETYNIGGKNEVKNLNLVYKICDLLNEILPRDKDYKKLVTFVTDRPGHDWRYAINNAKIQTELNWNPVYNLDQGLRETIHFYLKQGF